MMICQHCGREIYEWEPAVLSRGVWYHYSCYRELFEKSKRREQELWDWSRKWKPKPTRMPDKWRATVKPVPNRWKVSLS